MTMYIDIVIIENLIMNYIILYATGIVTKVKMKELFNQCFVVLENDIPNIICVQPFACLPNHVVGKGVIKTIRSLYPEANISPVDYDPGASEANQTNRIKLLMTVAKDNLKAKENAKKLIEKENSTDAKKEKIKINN